MMHSMWLTRNQQLQDSNLESLIFLTQSQICQEFKPGVQDLLPEDHFYILPSTTIDGFSLD